MRTQRVLLVTGLVTGGVGSHVHQVALGLRARGHDVRVACPVEVDELFGLSEAGLDVTHVVVGSRPNPRTDLTALGILRDLARDVEVVHAHGVRAGSLVCLAGSAASRRAVPVVVTVHNAPPHARAAAVVHAGLERTVAARAALVLAVSPDLRERMTARGAVRTDHAVVAAPEATAPSADGRERRRAELGVPPDGILALTVGRLAQQKGLDTLVEAATQFRDTCPQVRVVVAGEGPRRGALESLIAERALPMTLLGRRSDVPDLLAAADLAVSAARWEGQPVWLQEALHAGLPVVATDAGGTRTVLGGAARFVPVGDAAGLAEQIAALAGDPAERARMREVAAARADQLPGGDQAVEALERAYASVLRPTPPSPRVD